MGGMEEYPAAEEQIRRTDTAELQSRAEGYDTAGTHGQRMDYRPQYEGDKGERDTTEAQRKHRPRGKLRQGLGCNQKAAHTIIEDRDKEAGSVCQRIRPDLPGHSAAQAEAGTICSGDFGRQCRREAEEEHPCGERYIYGMHEAAGKQDAHRRIERHDRTAGGRSQDRGVVQQQEEYRAHSRRKGRGNPGRPQPRREHDARLYRYGQLYAED